MQSPLVFVLSACKVVAIGNPPTISESKGHIKNTGLTLVIDAVDSAAMLVRSMRYTDALRCISYLPRTLQSQDNSAAMWPSTNGQQQINGGTNQF